MQRTAENQALETGFRWRDDRIGPKSQILQGIYRLVSGLPCLHDLAKLRTVAVFYQHPLREKESLRFDSGPSHRLRNRCVRHPSGKSQITDRQTGLNKLTIATNYRYRQLMREIPISCWRVSVRTGPRFVPTQTGTPTASIGNDHPPHLRLGFLASVTGCDHSADTQRPARPPRHY